MLADEVFLPFDVIELFPHGNSIMLTYPQCNRHYFHCHHIYGQWLCLLIQREFVVDARLYVYIILAVIHIIHQHLDKCRTLTHTGKRTMLRISYKKFMENLESSGPSNGATCGFKQDHDDVRVEESYVANKFNMFFCSSASKRVSKLP